MPIEMGLLAKIKVDRFDNFPVVLFTFLTAPGCENGKPCNFLFLLYFLIRYFLIRQAPPLYFWPRPLLFRYISTYTWNMLIFVEDIYGVAVTTQSRCYKFIFTLITLFPSHTHV